MKPGPSLDVQGASSTVAARSALDQPVPEPLVRDMNPLKATGGIANLPGVFLAQKNPLPVPVHFATLSDLSRTDGPYESGAIRTRETAPGALGVKFEVGAAIVTGVEGEVWPISREKFESTYRPCEGSEMGRDGLFFKAPLPVLLLRIDEPFTVFASCGTLTGKPGDLLVQYDKEGREFGILGAETFDKTYKVLD